VKPNPEQPETLTAKDIDMAKRKGGRPRKITSSIMDVCTEQDLKNLMRATYVRAMRGEGTSLYWFLTQMPRMDQSFKLPLGLPEMKTLKGCVAAMDMVGDMARANKLTVAEADKALALINAIAHSKVSLLARAADKLDAELRAAIEQERQLEQRTIAAPAWSPTGGGLN